MDNNKDIFPIPAEHMCWYVTSKCNYSCQFCYRYHTTDSVNNLDKAKTIIDQVISLGSKRLTFTGEPLLMPWIKKGLEYSIKNSLFTTLMTNGSLLDKNWIDFLKSINIQRISLPLDGSSDEINQLITRPEGHFKRIIYLLNELNKTNIQIKITTMVSKGNINDLLNIASLLDDLNVHEWKVYQFRFDHLLPKKNKEFFEVEDNIFNEEIESVKNYYTQSGHSFKKISIQDRYMDYFQILSDGSIEISFGDKYKTIGNLLSDAPQLIHDNCLQALDDYEEIYANPQIREIIH